MIETAFLHEHVISSRRLGRHVRHDPRSWGFPAPMAPMYTTVRHMRLVPIFKQGNLGSCTGNAGAGCLSTQPFGRRLTEADAICIYSEATKIDSIRGFYPPEDTGSSGLAVMKALKKSRLISGYNHAFSLDQLLRALTLGPGILGMSWLSDCDNPDEKTGRVHYRGSLRGGHEVVLSGIDAEKKLVWMDNSWGEDWGFGGSFCMSFADMKKVLKDRGDAIFPAIK